VDLLVHLLGNYVVYDLAIFRSEQKHAIAYHLQVQVDAKKQAIGQEYFRFSSSNKQNYIFLLKEAVMFFVSAGMQQTRESDEALCFANGAVSYQFCKQITSLA
jgi:hypothetical protein